MSETEDLYGILQVVPDAHPQVIEGAYRALSYLYHPDRNAAPEAAEMRERVERAFEVLSDPVKRKRRARRPGQRLMVLLRRSQRLRDSGRLPLLQRGLATPGRSKP